MPSCAKCFTPGTVDAEGDWCMGCIARDKREKEEAAAEEAKKAQQGDSGSSETRPPKKR